MTFISTDDFIVSAAQRLASELLAAGYLVYWKRIDAVQFGNGPSDWKYGYSAAQTALLATSPWQAKLAASRGIVALVQIDGDSQDFITTGMTDGRVPVGNFVPVPSIAIDVGPITTQEALELGTNVHWRMRRLTLYTLARHSTEQRWFADHLAAWFDKGGLLLITNGASGNGATLLDSVRIDDMDVDTVTNQDDADAVTYEVTLNAGLLFHA